MSPRQIDRSPDLRHLRDDGFDVRIRVGYLVVGEVPYVVPGGGVSRGVLVDKLQLTLDETTSSPADHTMRWAGESPCDRYGQPLALFRQSLNPLQIDDELTTTHMFSAKPATQDPDYYEKFTRYLRLIAAHAEAVDPTVTPATFPVVKSDDEDSVFVYTDTASSRAGITALNDKLRAHCIAIVGVGGTGSYILDSLAKTEVREIHLFDGDTFLLHNAYRSPGVPTGDQLHAKPLKVTYHQERYSSFRRGIVPHPVYLTAANLEELNGMTFVFSPSIALPPSEPSSRDSRSSTSPSSTWGWISFKRMAPSTEYFASRPAHQSSVTTFARSTGSLSRMVTRRKSTHRTSRSWS
jgi:hypothetical protein